MLCSHWPEETNTSFDMNHGLGQTRFSDFGLGTFALLIGQLLCVGKLDQVQSIWSDWWCTQEGIYHIYGLSYIIYDKPYIYRDFYEIGHVIRSEYQDGPHIVAIILITKTKYACKLKLESETD